jgi:hypothetical protein
MTMIDGDLSQTRNQGERGGAWLWTAVALNFLLFYAVVLFQSLWFVGAFDPWRQAPNWGGPFVALIAAVALFSRLGDEGRARAAWLPGPRDATRRGLDPRLGDDPATRGAGKAYRFFRDYACFASLGGVIFAIAYIALILWSPMFIPTLEITALYFVFLVAQFVLARRAAARRAARLAEIASARGAGSPAARS